jgi:hypothetical protein
MIPMLAVILIAVWALGLLSGYTMGGLIHILLVFALIAVVHRFVTGRGIA